MRLLALFLLAGVAHATPSMLRESDDTPRGALNDQVTLQKNEGKRRYQLARAHWDAGRFPQALAEFEAGYATWPAPSFLVNIAQCLRKLDRPTEAAAAYQKYLDQKVGDSDVREEVSEARDELIGEIDQRMYTLAESVALFDAFLKSGRGDTGLRVRVIQTRAEVLRALVHLDDQLEAWVAPARRALAARRPMKGWIAFKSTLRRVF